MDVWIKDAELGDWFPSTVISKVEMGAEAKVPDAAKKLSSGESAGIRFLVTMSGYSEHAEGQDTQVVVGESENTTDLAGIKLRNDSSDKEVENLINLPYLHEPAILYCLEQRYLKSDIYTYTGPILIAVNPFKKVNLYSNQILETYYNAGLLKSQGIDTPTALAPHIYAIADAAFRDMMSAIHDGGRGGGGSSKGGDSTGKFELEGSCYSILAVSCFMWIDVLDSPDVLPS